MAPKNGRNESIADISRRAAYWCIRLKDQRRLPVKEALQFLAWLAHSRPHVHEFLRMRRIHDLLTRFASANGDRPDVTHVNWGRGSSLQPQKPERRRIGRWSVAAMVFVTLSATFLLTRMSEERSDRTIATVANESTTRRLEDGSVISLDSHSTLRVEYTDVRRGVHLSQGKGTFDVVMDIKRPFVVKTELFDIAAVESRFAVTLDTGVEVEVYEGVVTISERAAKAGTPAVRVKKGEKYRVAVNGVGLLVADRNVASKAMGVDG